MANVGNGNIAILSNPQPAGMPGPPFAPNSAAEGLTVNTGTGVIELGNPTGGLAGSLTVDRFIPLNGKTIHFIDNGGSDDVSISDEFISINDTGSGNNLNLGASSLTINQGTGESSGFNATGANFVGLNTPGSHTTIGFDLGGNTGDPAFDFTNEGADGGDSGVVLVWRDTFLANRPGFLFFPSGRIYSGETLPVAPVDNGVSQLQVAGSISTDQGTMSQPASDFRMGSVVAAPAVFDATQYVETEINGVLVKLAIVN